MTIQQIQYFLMAAEKMSFTETAKVMYVSQPAVSRQILLLEEEIGLELFRRNKSTLQLTGAGERLAAFFSKTFQEYRQIRNELKTDAHKLSGVVTLGSTAVGYDECNLTKQKGCRYFMKKLVYYRCIYWIGA